MEALEKLGEKMQVQGVCSEKRSIQRYNSITIHVPGPSTLEVFELADSFIFFSMIFRRRNTIIYFFRCQTALENILKTGQLKTPDDASEIV